MKINNISIKGRKSLLCYRIEGLVVSETAIEFSEFPIYCPRGELQDEEGYMYSIVPAAIIPIERDPDYDLEFLVYFKVGVGSSVIPVSRYLEDRDKHFSNNLENDGAVILAGVIPSQASAGEIIIDVIEVSDE